MVQPTIGRIFFINFFLGGVKVHDGFQDTFGRTVDNITSTVSSALQSKNVKKLTVVGHSLGAAVAVLDAVHLREVLDSSIQMTTTVFGLPRSGNQDWADFVDSTVRFFREAIYYSILTHLAPIIAWKHPSSCF